MVTIAHKYNDDFESIRMRSLQNFNVAFGLMTIIPILICLYLVAVKFYTIEILIGANGMYFLIAIVISLLGLLFGRTVLQRVIQQLATTTQHLEKVIRSESAIIMKLRSEISQHEKTQETLCLTEHHLNQAVKMETMGQLAAGAAHEVKNPLAMLSMGVDILGRSKIRESDKLSKTLDTMDYAVKKASGVLHDLLDYSRMTSVVMQPENLNKILDKSLELVKHNIDSSHVQVLIDYQSNIPLLFLDHTRMKQIFVNLITNALQAMPDGGTLKIRTYTRKTLDEVSHHKNGTNGNGYRTKRAREAVVEISDTGKGISQESMERIFEPFYTTKRDSGGTGLGLSVVKNLIEMHGAKISIKNNDQSGVIVKVALNLPGR